uniref:Uncharacterized protein n=1 Tax=Chromera velia CCMP2878 TaxID=1169474 RepID=A0A0G4I5E0_9ALVE|eukprot:Cvel_11143.t1-p1 / transcript=Cvel_11143.t1 / gene=Cvel_11143 / organism=Chromera_velia_CCMP2878 / gene_product=hypothetical protein / transcript_product=hypothetical protein / location=Cvel_scaffold691:3941-9578(+) / protein_length=376 / sequence_SO=supercontig / SO=protein_coding / is_pseudo=false
MYYPMATMRLTEERNKRVDLLASLSNGGTLFADVSVTFPISSVASRLRTRSKTAGAAAKTKSEEKVQKYAIAAHAVRLRFVPLVFETFGRPDRETVSFVKELVGVASSRAGFSTEDYVAASLVLLHENRVCLVNDGHFWRLPCDLYAELCIAGSSFKCAWQGFKKEVGLQKKRTGVRRLDMLYRAETKSSDRNNNYGWHHYHLVASAGSVQLPAVPPEGALPSRWFSLDDLKKVPMNPPLEPGSHSVLMEVMRKPGYLTGGISSLVSGVRYAVSSLTAMAAGLLRPFSKRNTPSKGRKPRSLPPKSRRTKDRDGGVTSRRAGKKQRVPGSSQGVRNSSSTGLCTTPHTRLSLSFASSIGSSGSDAVGVGPRRPRKV